jgi:branched-chain amino acid transport system substrate-binding protein
MAIEDVGGLVAGRSIELLLGDHHNDEREAAAIARRWFIEQDVDMVISGVNSDTSLAMTVIAAPMGKLVFVVGAGTSVQTRERAAPSILQYAYSTVGLSTAPCLILTREGHKRWFYPFGAELEEHGRAAVERAGGTIVGSVKNPHGVEDFAPHPRDGTRKSEWPPSRRQLVLDA